MVIMKKHARNPITGKRVSALTVVLKTGTTDNQIEKICDNFAKHKCIEFVADVYEGDKIDIDQLRHELDISLLLEHLHENY